MTVIPALRGFLRARSIPPPPPILTFATIAPVAVSGNPNFGGSVNTVAVPCTVQIPSGSYYAEYVSGGINAGFATTGSPVRGQAPILGLTITNGMALWGQCDAPQTHTTATTVTVRVRAAAGGTILGTFTFSFSTN